MYFNFQDLRQRRNNIGIWHQQTLSRRVFNLLRRIIRCRIEYSMHEWSRWMKKESTGGGCSAGEEIDTSQQRCPRVPYNRGGEERKWAVVVALFAQRASRDKSVYREVTRGWFTDWGVVGTIAAAYTRVKVNMRIPYANMVVDVANESSTFLCFSREGQKIYREYRFILV